MQRLRRRSRQITMSPAQAVKSTPEIIVERISPRTGGKITSSSDFRPKNNLRELYRQVSGTESLADSLSNKRESLSDSGEKTAVSLSQAGGRVALFPFRKRMKFFLVLVSFMFLSSCASKMSLIQTGPWSGGRDVKDIKHFVSRNQIKESWIAIAVIRGDKVNPSDRKKINKEIERAKQMAADIGADGVVLVEKRVTKSTARFSKDIGKVFITGIAIQYVTEEQTKQNR